MGDIHDARLPGFGAVGKSEPSVLRLPSANVTINVED
jgi:hypothetical protein